MSKRGHTLPRFVPLLRSASLVGYAELAREVGLDPDAMLRQAGLNSRHLADPDTPISTSAVRLLLEASAAASGVEDFGLRLASTRTLSNLGPLSVVMREAKTAREAIDNLCRYMRLLNASLLTRVEEHEDLSVVHLEVLTADRESVRQVTELSMGVLYRSIAELLGPSWKPRSVCLEHRRPHGPTIHKAVFGVSVEFDVKFQRHCLFYEAAKLAAVRRGLTHGALRASVPGPGPLFRRRKFGGQRSASHHRLAAVWSLHGRSGGGGARHRSAHTSSPSSDRGNEFLVATADRAIRVCFSTHCRQ